MMVAKARREEIEYFYKMKVFDKVPLKECYDQTGSPPLKARWIDHNKGDQQHPKYLGRWVAKQFKHLDSQEWFAATPPVECLRMMLGDVAT